jgi:hypothetical protein
MGWMGRRASRIPRMSGANRPLAGTHAVHHHFDPYQEPGAGVRSSRVMTRLLESLSWPIFPFIEPDRSDVAGWSSRYWLHAVPRIAAGHADSSQWVIQGRCVTAQEPIRAPRVACGATEHGPESAPQQTGMLHATLGA